ncbi:MAG: carboxypeptidase-like regulatory domain-containing protein, partial [Bacteroidetes bacterium]|nr:carboxypeptidase-like regulatory domain-containing protein [Bacteroidota bacterium]
MRIKETLLAGAIILVSATGLSAQSSAVSGTVFQSDNGGPVSPLPGAAVYRSDFSATTQTDLKGRFELPAGGSDTVIVSFVGFNADTVIVGSKQDLQITLFAGTVLNTVEVEAAKESYFISRLDPIKTEVVTRDELHKAACCNLSESFETSNTVSAVTTDAVTGNRQIEMLGLSGVYTQIQRENLPQLRGLITHSGLSQIPGTWIEKIRIGKGVGSVVNGFESISGQIDIQLRAPFGPEKMQLNAYSNMRGRNELNFFRDIRIGKKWSTLTMLHGSFMNASWDRNGDGFMDNPDSRQWNAENRWQFIGKRMEAQFGFHALQEEKTSGTTAALNMSDASKSWIYNNEVSRGDAFFKLGILYPGYEFKSLAVLGNGFLYRQNTNLGNRQYLADWQSLSTQIIYQNYIASDSRFSFKTGINVLYDAVNEIFDANDFGRRESNIGGYFEHTFKTGIFTLINGFRLDYNNLYGWFFIPRLHAKFDLGEHFTFRLAGGKGRRTANVISENTGYLASSRQLQIESTQNLKSSAYGLLPELAWNYGGGLVYQYKWGRREGSLSADAWYTSFDRQTVVDLDYSPQKLLIYNLDGASTALSSQFDWTQAAGRAFTLRLSYKYTQSKTQFKTGNLFRPFVPFHRALFNLGWKARKDKWLADLTINYQGEKRLPGCSSNPAEYQMRRRSPDFALINMQLTRNIKNVALYAGVENLFDFRQLTQIVAAENPQSIWFDASYIWGPTLGRVIYVGMR